MGRMLMGYWDCTYCQHKKLRADVYVCPTCGNPRDKDIHFYMDENHKEYVPENQQKQIHDQGPDWLCPFCDTYNHADRTQCKGCGAPRDNQAKTYFEQQRYLKEKAKKSDTTSTEYHTYSMYEPKNNEPEESPDPEPQAYHKPTDSANSGPEFFPHKNILSGAKSLTTSAWQSIKRFRKPILIGLLVIAVLIGIVALIVHLTQPSTIRVTDKTWSIAITIEEHKLVREDDWSLPSGATLAYTKEEYHHTERVFDHYEKRSRQVSEKVYDGDTITYSYIDHGNGYFEEVEHRVPHYHTEWHTEYYDEPIYVPVPIYKTKYYYDIMRWVYCRTETASGHTDTPYEPEFKLAENERRGSTTATYTIIGYVEDKDTQKTTSWTTSRNIWDQMYTTEVYTVKTSFGKITEIVKNTE